MGSLDHIGRVVFFTEARLTDPPPISINAAYMTVRNRRILSDEGRAFKDALALAVSQSTFDWKTASDTVYKNGGFGELSISIFFADLTNDAWKPGGMTKGGKKPGKTGKIAEPKPQTPYQPKDASNYIKLIEDAVVKGSGIDDANTLAVHAYKWIDRQSPRIEIVYQVYELHPQFRELHRALRKTPA